MVLSTEEIMRFKETYLNKMKQGTIKVSLTPTHRDRHDIWAYEVLGNAEFIFMYPILILNEEDAMENGYFVAGSESVSI